MCDRQCKLYKGSNIIVNNINIIGNYVYEICMRQAVYSLMIKSICYIYLDRLYIFVAYTIAKVIIFIWHVGTFSFCSAAFETICITSQCIHYHQNKCSSLAIFGGKRVYQIPIYARLTHIHIPRIGWRQSPNYLKCSNFIYFYRHWSLQIQFDSLWLTQSYIYLFVRNTLHLSPLK